jgi:hypothetical protein
MKKRQYIDIAFIINELTIDFILNLCLLNFIIISTYQNSEDKDKFYSINVAMDIGRKMIRKYLFSMKHNDINYKETSYSDWYSEKISSNELLLKKIENDQVIAHLGFALIHILECCNMVTSELIVKSKDEKYYILTVDKKLLAIGEKYILYFPLKLPMIIKPKPYNKKKN